jgi:hypothetical protein
VEGELRNSLTRNRHGSSRARRRLCMVPLDHKAVVGARPVRSGTSLVLSSRTSADQQSRRRCKKPTRAWQDDKAAWLQAVASVSLVESSKEADIPGAAGEVRVDNRLYFEAEVLARDSFTGGAPMSEARREGLSSATEGVRRGVLV